MNIKMIVIQLYKIIYKRYLIRKAKRELGGYGAYLFVNGSSVFSRNMIVGDHCNFNGMKIVGGVEN